MLGSVMRLLIPSWRFFDRVGPRFELQWKFVDLSSEHHSSHLDSMQWQPLFKNEQTLERDSSLKRLLLRSIYNPHGNLQLAVHSLVERFVQSLEHLEGQYVNPEYISLLRAVRMVALERFPARAKDPLCFRIRSSDPLQSLALNSEIEPETIFYSGPMVDGGELSSRQNDQGLLQ